MLKLKKRDIFKIGKGLLQAGKNITKKTSEPSDDSRFFAEFSNQAYNKDKKDLNGYEFQTTFNDNLDVYKKDDKVIFSHKGTDPKDPNDLYTDAKLAKGEIKDTSRYKNSKKFVDDYMRKNPDVKAMHTGHSLGGKLANEIANDFNHRSIGFNSGASPLENSSKNKNHREFATKNDPISLSNMFQQNVSYINQKPGENPHSINNFL
jgi:hypothetical protein